MAFTRRCFGLILTNARTFSRKPTAQGNGTKQTLYFRNQIISEICRPVSNNPNPSNELCRNIRDSLVEAHNINPNIVDSLILNNCLMQSNADGAISYYKFLQNNNYDIHIAVIRNYFAACYTKNSKLTEAEKEYILHAYDRVQKEYPYLDDETVVLCVRVLCLTDRWKEACELVEKNNCLTKPILAPIICAAFRNGETDLGWKYLLQMCDLGLSLPLNIHTEYLGHCEKDKSTFNDNIEKIFNIWRNYNIVPSADVINEYVHYCNQMGWKAAYETQFVQQRCKHCSQELLADFLSKQEFKILSNVILEKVLVGEDIYRKSTPKELYDFQKFIKKTKPFDVIIDGLNVMFSSRSSAVLRDLADHFYSQNKVVLVLGRNHLRKDSQFHEIQRKSLVYVLPNMTDDDAYLLYAAFTSGQGTKIISHDFMRQHKSRLGELYLKKLFERWQATHQCAVIINNGKSKVSDPSPVGLRAQKKNNCWHIPFKMSHNLNWHSPTSWACFMMNHNGASKYITNS